MERESIPFLSLILRQLCLDKHGSRVVGLVSKTFLKDMESGAQILGEELGLFPRNHKPHTYEVFRGSLGDVFPAETGILGDGRNLLATYTPHQQQRIGTEIHQPGSCSTWSPDLKHPQYGLLVILMSMILHQPNPFDQTGCNGQPLCINAFLDNHPVLKKQLKSLGLKTKSLFDDSLFTRDDRGNAVVEITVRILCNMIYGGWEYMDENKTALKYLGISIFDYLAMFGYRHRYTCSSCGDIIMTIDMGDGKFHEMFVHKAPSYQGSIQGGNGGRLEASNLHGMWRTAISNRFRSHWSKMLMTQSETPALVDNIESLIKEPVRRNNLVMALLYYHAVKNTNMTLQEASRISKAFMVTEEDLLSPTFNPKAMMSVTNLIGISQREKDARLQRNEASGKRRLGYTGNPSMYWGSGVTQTKDDKWQAQTTYNGKVKYIGVFDVKEIALSAVKLVREKLSTSDGSTFEGDELKRIIKCACDAAHADYESRIAPLVAKHIERKQRWRRQGFLKSTEPSLQGVSNQEKKEEEDDTNIEQQPSKRQKVESVPKVPKAPPKKVLTYYSNEVRNGIKNANPTASTKEINKMISVNFNALSAEERAPYLAKFTADQERYKRETLQWAEIAKRIPGRDESSVRNRWYNAKTSEKKAKSKAEQATIQKQNVDSFKTGFV